MALIEGLRELAQEMRERALPDIGDDWGDAMTEAAIMVEKFIEDTGENVSYDIQALVDADE